MKKFFAKLKKIYYGIIQRGKQFWFSLHKNDIYVLMFHDVCVDENMNTTLNINRNNFENVINCLKDRNVEFVSVGEILKNNNGKRCVITFDDVYKGAILNAIPILNKLNIPFTLFISSCYVDHEKYISSEQIIELCKNPLCTIGFHTKNHTIMRNLNKSEITDEINCDMFEKKYKARCEFFAYPYGSIFAVSKKSIKIVKNNKYKLAFGTISSPLNCKIIRKNRFFIPRINVSDSNFNKVLRIF